jgi:hypothetical protein
MKAILTVFSVLLIHSVSLGAPLALTKMDSALDTMDAAQLSKVDTIHLMALDQVVGQALDSMLSDGFVKVKGSLDRDELIQVLGFEANLMTSDANGTIATFHGVTLRQILKASSSPSVISIQASKRLFPNPAITVRN